MENPNPEFEQRLQGLPVFCSNFKEGCRNMFAQEEALNEHKIGCEFRFGIHKQRLLTWEGRDLPPKGEKRRHEEEHSFQQMRRLL